MTNSPSPLTTATAEAVLATLNGPHSTEKLHRALRILAKWRSELLGNTLIGRSGTAVLSGPFKGMDYAVRASEGSRASRQIGCYEASLAPVIEAIIAKSPEIVVDIGSAEGYYAVGLARRLPEARVMARDASSKAQQLCAQLARANGVEKQVEIGGIFNHSDFALCNTAKTVVICDIEGAEDALLDPVAAPGLLNADILVECHDGMFPGLADRIRARFDKSHRVTRIDRKLDDSGMPDWMEELSDLDRLMALWEWRAGPTPWLWMEKR